MAPVSKALAPSCSAPARVRPRSASYRTPVRSSEPPTAAPRLAGLSTLRSSHPLRIAAVLRDPVRPVVLPAVHVGRGRGVQLGQRALRLGLADDAHADRHHAFLEPVALGAGLDQVGRAVPGWAATLISGCVDRRQPALQLEGEQQVGELGVGVDLPAASSCARACRSSKSIRPGLWALLLTVTTRAPGTDRPASGAAGRSARSGRDGWCRTASRSRRRSRAAGSP